MGGQDCGQLTLFPADSPVSPFPLPGSDEAVRTTAISGRKCSELLKNCGPIGSLVKMLLESSIWRSTRCFLTWKASVTPHRRLLFRLVPSTPRTGATDAPFWPTVQARDWKGPQGKSYLGKAVDLPQAVKMWPTPTAMDAKGLDRHPRKDMTTARSCLLSQKVALFPTPTRFDAECGDLWGKEYNGETLHAMKLIQAAKLFPTPTGRCGRGASQTETRQGGPDLQTEVGGQLNPTWVEWLMGFPLGWTDLGASETP